MGIKCENCQYRVEEKKENQEGYDFCCLYCQPIDRCIILNLCPFVDNESKEDEID